MSFVKQMILISNVWIVISLASIPNASLSQEVNSYNIIWERTFGRKTADAIWSVQQTSDGGYILAGYTEVHGSTSGGCLFGVPMFKESYKEDVWLIKTDAQGKKTWEQTFSGPATDIAHSVQQTQDGGYILAGETSGDVWLIKTDAEGQMLWNRKFGGEYGDAAYCVQQVSDGGYVLAGVTGVRKVKVGQAGGMVIKKSAGGDVWLIKTDAEGRKLWERTFGGKDWDVAFSFCQALDGGYLLAGATDSYGAGKSDAWLIKTDAEGRKLWGQTFGGENTDIAFSVQQTSDGEYVFAGLKRGLLFTLGGDAWLVKTDAEGKKLWEWTFGSENGGAFSVQQTSDGGYIIGAWIQIHTVLAAHMKSYQTGGNDGWLIKTDAEGKKTKEQILGGKKNDYVTSVQQISDGKYIIAGWTQSQGAGREDAWLIKVGKVNSE